MRERAHKILGKKAAAICVAYDGMDRFFPKDKIIVTGNPVRATIAQSHISRQEGVAAFSLDASRKTILVVGGSLGAKTINEAIAADLKTITGWGVQLIWQTGKLFIDEAKKAAAPYRGQVIVQEFIKNMEYAYAAADIVVSRAGALASAELCIAGKPVIFVPYPYAAEDHQTSNALALVEHNAAMMVKDNEAGTSLVKKLDTLVHDEKMQELMAGNIVKHGIRDADERIAQKVIAISRK